MPNTSNQDFQLPRQGRMIMSGADLDTDVARMFHNPGYYIAGMDPVDLNAPASRSSNFTLLTGPRGYAELTHAIQERITQERARPATAYDMAGTVERYGHLLTAADQQRLGYVAPVTEDYSLHPEESTRTERSSPLQMYRIGGRTSSRFGYDSGNRQGARKTSTEPVANFLASPPGPTDQELAAADEWLRNSPWG